MNNKIVKLLIFAIMIVYAVSPDLFPGPVDDILMILLGMAAQKKNLLPEKE